jgi:hypothetical protein
MTVAEMVMVVTLLLMVSGKAPIYLTAAVGSAIAALAFGVPIRSGEGATLTSLLQAGLHPVLVDMLGVLLFIGIMEKTGFLQIIIMKIMEVGHRLGGGPGICTAGGVAAGIIGGLTGFTQPAITAVITGPAAVKLGVKPNEAAGTQALANALGNFGGFTHPTMVAVVATTGIRFGMINVIGVIVGLSAFAMSFWLLSRRLKGRTFEAVQIDLQAVSNAEFFKAILPFITLFVGFIVGFPIILVGIVSAMLVVFLSAMSLAEGEQAMMEGVARIATPLFATIAFLFMSAVIEEIGLVYHIKDAIEPFLRFAPIQIMLLVAAVTAFVTQSNSASIAIVIPFLQVVLATGADPFAAAVAAAGAPAIMQLFLTGGPVAGLATVIPVIPGSDLKGANRFQRPSILFSLLVLLVITFFI